MEICEFLFFDYFFGVNKNMYLLFEFVVEFNFRDSFVFLCLLFYDLVVIWNVVFVWKCWDVDVGVKVSLVFLICLDLIVGSEDIK